jgi:hypothetical protein
MILQRAQNPNIGGVKRDGLHLGTDCRLGTVQGGQFQGHIRAVYAAGPANASKCRWRSLERSLPLFASVASQQSGGRGGVKNARHWLARVAGLRVLWLPPIKHPKA